MIDFMQMLMARVEGSSMVDNAIASVLAILVLIVLRKVMIRSLLHDDMPLELRRRILVNSRNVLLLVILLALVYVWADQIRTLALSAVAIAAAIVLATKELILCLSGAVYRASSSTFKVGDRIEVGAFRGDVIDQTLLSTTILEIGPGQSSHQHTGRTIVIPNSMLLTAGVINETFTDDYVLHLFTVPLKTEDDWLGAEEKLLEAAHGACGAYLEEAKRHFETMWKRFSLEPTQIDPRVSVLFPEPGRVNLLVRVPVPARRKGRVEQAILRRFFEVWDDKKTEDEDA